ncbi:F-box/LRR-repeat protein [Panicum miliaceum]|uniref:F-box/LRR-repeat protein n=1 Tax=Panicum miliaceum TaxID=4540 RepID=A0A3L6RT64_PANMI|nr:F-box/LRR-repeat protein [Panicum miliaceum]
MSVSEPTERDRLRELPDDLLHRILRFLDTRQVVTDLSSLSLRWRYLWATLPFITLRSGYNVSEKFGNLLLLLLDGTVPLRTFCLHSCYWKNIEYEHRWLRHALTRGLCVLELNLSSGHRFQLPECVFSCTTLEEFNLFTTSMESIAPRSVCLPGLKKLLLHAVRFADPSVAEKISSGCPALEDLSLSLCSLGSFKILSDTLKILSITNCHSEEIHVSAPNLCSLRLTVSGEVHLDGMPFLVSAQVHLCDGGVQYLAQSGYDLAAALCNAQHLELFRFNLFLQDITGGSALEGLSFCKLKNLYIGEWRVADFYGPLAYFLWCAPNLVALTLDQWKLYQLHNGNANLEVLEKKSKVELKLVSSLTRDLETLLIRLSKGDDTGEFRKVRRLLKEKTKPKETDSVVLDPFFSSQLLCSTIVLLFIDIKVCTWLLALC